MLTVANVYGDPDTDQAALETMTRIHNILNDIKMNFNPKIIVGGDFNTTLEERDSLDQNQSQEQQTDSFK